MDASPVAPPRWLHVAGITAALALSIGLSALGLVGLASGQAQPTPAQIRTALAREQSALDACMTTYDITDPVEVSLSIAPDGTVSSTSMGEDEDDVLGRLAAPERRASLASCLDGALGALRFPRGAARHATFDLVVQRGHLRYGRPRRSHPPASS